MQKIPLPTGIDDFKKLRSNNNYYIDKDQEEAFSFLLIDVVSAFAGEKSLAAVVQTEHQETFEKQGFTVEKVWKRYVKMWRDE